MISKNISTGGDSPTHKNPTTQENESIHPAGIKTGQTAARKLKLNFRTAVELANATEAEVPWVAEPWVALSSITEVVGKPKAAGKTSWILAMVRCVLHGESFMGESTEQTSVVYLTEERSSTFREALKRARLLDRNDLHVLEWRDTHGVEWPSVVLLAVEKCQEVGAKLLVVDTVSQFATLTGDAENNAGDVLT